MVNETRRGFLLGIGSLIASPAIVRAASLMPVKAYQLYTIECRHPFMEIPCTIEPLQLYINFRKELEDRIVAAFGLSSEELVQRRGVGRAMEMWQGKLTMLSPPLLTKPGLPARGCSGPNR